MKKRFLLLAGLSFSAMTFAQQQAVGVNTEDPKVTLDVAGQPTETSIMDGIRAPQIEGDELNAKTYSEELKGAIVYVTKAAEGEKLAGQTVNVSTSGYYYFDGQVWLLLSGNDWHVTGNAGTDATKNFLGTTDDTPLVFKTNGVQSGYIGTDGKNPKNTAFGYKAFETINEVKTESNLAVGSYALNKLNIGPNNKMIGANVAVGSGALSAAINSSFTTAIGSGAMKNAQNSWNNTAVGQGAMGSLDGGSNNTGVGGGTLAGLTSGSANVTLGLTTLAGLTTGGGNIAIGTDAGTGVTTGGANIMIGYGATVDPERGGLLNLGNLIYGTGMGAGIYARNLKGDAKRVGILTSGVSGFPTETFDVNGTIRVRKLPKNGQANSISTPASGLADANNALKNNSETFNATRMVVADANGVLGTAELGNTNSLYSTIANGGIVDLNSQNASMYVVEDASTSDVIIKLPKNQTTSNTSRTIRLLVLPKNGGAQGDLKIQYVGNSNGTVGGMKVSDRVVTIQADSADRTSKLLTFVEFGGKWYLTH
ncbi:hypothetical protein [Ornithobacterium rhinotracheale]|uniref:hypothetical protein n=1 Tax=Ornithobacterium rhinotracheale TaxID=28251 RepID=UPI004036CB19